MALLLSRSFRSVFLSSPRIPVCIGSARSQRPSLGSLGCRAALTSTRDSSSGCWRVSRSSVLASLFRPSIVLLLWPQCARIVAIRACGSRPARRALNTLRASTWLDSAQVASRYLTRPPCSRTGSTRLGPTCSGLPDALLTAVCLLQRLFAFGPQPHSLAVLLALE